MDLADLLEKIQNKPLHTRKMILYSSVAVIMSFVLLLWITTISSTVSRVTTKANERPEEAEESFESKASFSEIIHDARVSIQDKIQETRSLIQGESQPSELELLREEVAAPNTLDFKLNTEEFQISN